MKQEYFEKLEKLLKESNVPNYEEVLEKYRKRYDFGIESELSEDEIESMLGTPESVVKKYIEGSNGETKEKSNRYNKLSVKTVADEITIESSPDDKAHVLLDDSDREFYNIQVTSSGIIVEYLSSKYLSLNRRRSGELTIQIPDGRIYNEALIETASGDIKIDYELNADKFSLNMVSGDSSIKKLNSNNAYLNVVSGDIDIKEVNTDKIVINTVSGDIDIDVVNANKIVIDGVSGDININHTSTTDVVTNSITGDVTVNGQKMKNCVVKVKGAFKL